MDLVLLLERSISEIPKGDYSIGLNAILRHVRSAIQHFERDKSVEPDACTDAIYRTNQAYEGSLKEAYRVLAGKDPSKITLHDIELYLNSNNIVRPRVLTQLTRYRQDYRNPSTHDYKLDFDSDEALLAILSVCGFAQLLVHQIRSKLNSNIAQEKISEKVDNIVNNASNLAEAAAAICLSYTQESDGVEWFEYERGIFEALQAAGVQGELLIKAENSDEENISNDWDIIIRHNGKTIGIDSLVSRFDKGKLEPMNLGYYAKTAEVMDVDGVIVILRSYNESSYGIYRATEVERDLFFILEDDDISQREKLEVDLGCLVRIDAV